MGIKYKLVFMVTRLSDSTSYLNMVNLWFTKTEIQEIDEVFRIFWSITVGNYMLKVNSTGILSAKNNSLQRMTENCF